MADVRDAKRLGQAVHRRRVEKDWTQQELADDSGLSLSTVRNIEAGRVGTRRGQSLPAVERSLDWMPGSAENVLAGGDPELVEPSAPEREPARFVSSRSRAVNLSEVPLEDLQAEMNRRIEDLVRQAVANNPDARRP